MTLSLPSAKVCKIRKECSHVRNQSLVSARQLAKLIGLLTSCLAAIEPAPLHYRALQRLKNLALSQGDHSYDQRIILSHESPLDLQWWIQNISTDVQRPILKPSPVLTLETDASLTGWGAYCQNSEESTGNTWTREEARHHINARIKRSISCPSVLCETPEQFPYFSPNGQPSGHNL